MVYVNIIIDRRIVSPIIILGIWSELAGYDAKEAQDEGEWVEVEVVCQREATDDFEKSLGKLND